MDKKELEHVTSFQNVNNKHFNQINQKYNISKAVIINSKKKIVLIGVIILFILMGRLIFLYLPIITIEGQDFFYTYSDIYKLSEVEQWIGEIIGSGVKTKKETLYYLIISGIKKEILRENNISIAQDNAIQTVESNTILKGLYAKIKKYMKDDYYTLIIEPMATDDIFRAFFRSNNPSRKFTEKLHTEALQLGLKNAADKEKIEVWELAISENEKNREIISEIKEMTNRSNKVYDKIMEFDANYVLIELKDITDKGIVVNRAIVKKMTENEFLKKKMKHISINFNLLSLFDKNDFKKIYGSIFHE